MALEAYEFLYEELRLQVICIFLLPCVPRQWWWKLEKIEAINSSIDFSILVFPVFRGIWKRISVSYDALGLHDWVWTCLCKQHGGGAEGIKYIRRNQASIHLRYPESQSTSEEHSIVLQVVDQDHAAISTKRLCIQHRSWTEDIDQWARYGRGADHWLWGIGIGS